MRTVLKFFAERHLLANVLMILVILCGLRSLWTLSRDTYPNVDLGEVIVTTRFPGGSPEDVELKVTNKIEDELKSVSGLDKYLSYSRENISLVHVYAGVNKSQSRLDETKQDIRDAINRVTTFPAEVKESPLISEVKTSIIPILEVGLAGEYPYRELREIARIFEKKLETLDGVSRIERHGWKAREVKVEVDPAKIKKYQISLQEITAAIRARNIRGTGGSFESFTSERNIVTLAQFKNPHEVAHR